MNYEFFSLNTFFIRYRFVLLYTFYNKSYKTTHFSKIPSQVRFRVLGNCVILIWHFSAVLHMRCDTFRICLTLKKNCGLNFGLIYFVIKFN